MEHRVYAVYDSCAKAYLPPFHLPRDEMASRAFTDCVNSASHQFAEHTEDYALYTLGTFDDSTGIYVNHTPGPRLICTGLGVKIRPTDRFTENSTEAE